MRIQQLVLVAAALLAGTAAAAQRTDGGDGVVVSAAWLAQHLHDPSVVVLDVTRDSADYAAGHIPGARRLSYADFTTVRGGIHTELPPVAALQALFERLGVSTGSHVVVYTGDGMAPMASRAFFTLDYLGNVRVSYLDGGWSGWRAAGGAVDHTTPAVARGKYAPRPRPDIVVDAAWVEAHLGKRGVALIDTRTNGEYVGAGERHGMPSEGHLAGARQLQWEQLFSDSNAGTLLSRSELAKLYADRVPAGDTVVTYCWVGYRASMTYMAARVVGLPVKLYDGSYEDWLNRKLPVVPGKNPL